MVSQPVRAEPGPEPTTLDLQPLSCFCSAPTPSSLLRGLRENSLSFVLIGGSSTCPLLGLGNALNCPLLELVGACLAFAWIGQFSVTPQAEGRIMAVRGGMGKETLGELGQQRGGVLSGLDADMAHEARSSLPGILLSTHLLALPCLPQDGGC